MTGAAEAWALVGDLADSVFLSVLLAGGGGTHAGRRGSCLLTGRSD